MRIRTVCAFIDDSYNREIKKEQMCEIHMGNKELHTTYWWKSKGKDHLTDPGVDGRIILKLVLEKYDVNCIDNLLYTIFQAFLMTVIRIWHFWLLCHEWCLLSGNMFSHHSADWCVHILEQLDSSHTSTYIFTQTICTSHSSETQMMKLIRCPETSVNFNHAVTQTCYIVI